VFSRRDGGCHFWNTFTSESGSVLIKFGHYPESLTLGPYGDNCYRSYPGIILSAIIQQRLDPKL
jgi:hypothetical protein